MNLDPPIDFDPDEALSNFGDPDQKLYGLSERIYFYLIETCRSVQVFAGPAFTIDSVFGPPGLTPQAAGSSSSSVKRSGSTWRPRA